MTERNTLALVLESFRDCEDGDPIAVVAVGSHDTATLTHGDLRRLAADLIHERARANESARALADLRDERDAALDELGAVQERFAELATERDVLTVRLEDARTLSSRGTQTETWYRALSDGRLWCESRDPAEVIRQTALLDHPAVLQQMIMYEVTDGWQEWKP